MSKNKLSFNEITARIRDNGNTCMIPVYAIQSKSTGLIINYKNNMFYTTRQQARDVRQLIGGTDVKIVKTSFVNIDTWITAK